MLKLIKYEYRKNLTVYIIIFGILFGLEIYLAASLLAKSESNIVISMLLYMLVGFAVIMAIMIIGVISYAREINSRHSFMIFMTPNSTYKIVGAKYLTLLFTSVVTTVIYGLFLYIDIKLALKQYSNVSDMIDLINEFMSLIAGKSITAYIIGLVSMVLSMWVSILLTVSFAYLAITLSNTILANRRGKGWLAVGFFVAIRIATRVIEDVLPRFDYGTETVLQVMSGSWPSYLFNVIFIAGTYVGVSELLKRKISL